MNVDTNESGEEILARGAALPEMAARIRTLIDRFPAVSKGLCSIFDQAIVSGTSFFTAAIIGRASSPEQFGLYYLLLTIVLTASAVQEQVIAGPYMVYSKHRSGRALNEYAGSIWLHHLILTVVIFAGFMAAIVACSAAGKKEFLPGLWAMLGAAPLILLRDGIRRFCFANLQMKLVIVLDATVALVQLGALLLLHIYGRLSLFNIFAVMGGACLLASVGWYLLARPQLEFTRSHFLPDWTHNWAFGKWALWSYVVCGTLPHLMLWSLGVAIGTSATAMLGACLTLVGVTNVLQAGVSNVLTPLAAEAYARGGSARLRRILMNTAQFLVLALGSICAVFAATGDWLPVFVFGPAYEGSGSILFVLGLSAVMSAIGNVAGNGLWAVEQTRAAFVADVFCMIVTLLAAGCLISPLGPLGAALAILAGTFTAASARIVFLARSFREEDLTTSFASPSA